jgi:predicted XRE-type DNA-binding protein
MRRRTVRGSKTKARTKPASRRRPPTVADFGLSPELGRAKVELAERIRHLIAKRELNQIQAAELLGLDQPKVSALIHGRIEGYSIDRLIRCLNALGQQVKIVISPAAKAIKTHKVVVA